MASATDDLWNRALDDDWPATRPGDLALRTVLTFDGLVRSGGFWYAVEVHAVDEDFPIDAVADGYRTLGLEAVASAVERAYEEYEQTSAIGDEDAWADAEDRINEEYTLDEDHLTAALERTYAQEPEAFAPLG
ncbi:hypothetical protein AB3M83_05110 [Microbacterium sp. 179-B 1A2 NHS]|uniref:DMP19 family protein n=1 Tax=Microbacterium sp. 179-B 1A2 NHS TaxID=3142383 RepID=UPI0039A370CA